VPLSSTLTPLLLVQPPLDARHASVAHVVGDLVEEDVCAVDGAVEAAHALVTDGCLDGGAGSGVVQRNAAAAVRVAVRGRAHELIWQRNCQVAVCVDVGTAGAEAAVPVRDVADAGVAFAFTGAA
jgi:hypothetical protein